MGQDIAALPQPLEMELQEGAVFAIAPIASRMAPVSKGAAGGAAVASEDDCGGGIDGARGGAREVPGGEGCGGNAGQDGGGAPVAVAKAKAAKEMVWTLLFSFLLLSSLELSDTQVYEP